VKGDDEASVPLTSLYSAVKLLVAEKWGDVVKSKQLSDLKALKKKMPELAVLRLPVLSIDSAFEYQAKEKAYASWLTEVIASLEGCCGVDSIEVLLFKVSVIAPLPAEASPGEISREARQLSSDYNIGQLVGILANPTSIFSSPPSLASGDFFGGDFAKERVDDRRKYARVKHTLSQIIDRLELGYGPTVLPNEYRRHNPEFADRYNAAAECAAAADALIKGGWNSVVTKRGANQAADDYWSAVLLSLSSLSIASGWTTEKLNEPGPYADRLLGEPDGAELLQLLAIARSVQDPELSSRVRAAYASSIEKLVRQLVAMARKKWE
jgi:hypothetical protein